MNINSSNFIKALMPYIVVVLLGYLFSNIAFIFLPKYSVEYKLEDNLILKYRVFNIKHSLDGDKIIVKKVRSKPKKQEYKLLANIKLIAIYATTNHKGWITIEDNKNITHILSYNDLYRGYKLNKIFNTYVIFTKNNQEYKLSLKQANKNTNYSITKTDKEEKQVEKIIIDDGKVTVKRDYVNKYINNFNKIWKDISINEVFKNGKINGFKVIRIRSNSVFSKLGLRQGDILKEVNNIELKSYNDAFKIYKKINKINNLHIKVLRNNQEVELDYEIK